MLEMVVGLLGAPCTRRGETGDAPVDFVVRGEEVVKRRGAGAEASHQCGRGDGAPGRGGGTIGGRALSLALLLLGGAWTANQTMDWTVEARRRRVGSASAGCPSAVHREMDLDAHAKHLGLGLIDLSLIDPVPVP